MIIDNLKNARAYEHMHPLFKKAFDYLHKTDFTEITPGKIELEGTDLFVIVSDSSMRKSEDAKIEVHNEYIDIQMPVSKSETFGWISRSNLKESVTSFDQTKDIQFFEEKGEIYYQLSPGNFSIFFPQDGHAPCIGDGYIRKVVVKVKL